MKVKVELCMGSSCFARGNSRILSFLEGHLAGKGWSDKVEISGHLCMSNCSGGPVVRIEGVDYLNRDEKQIAEIIGACIDEQ